MVSIFNYHPKNSMGKIKKMIINRMAHCFFVLSFSIVISCSGPSLTEYVCNNKEEQKIISLLIKYEKAKVNCNLIQYLDCLHEKGTFQFGRGYMVSKKELEESLAEFWAGLQSGSPVVYPMNREMITGNYIISGRFYNPKIAIRLSTAEVTMTFIKWGWRQGHFVSLIKENGQWLISKLDWQEN